MINFILGLFYGFMALPIFMLGLARWCFINQQNHLEKEGWDL